VLGVSPAASDEEVRSAYRRRAQLHHPDHNPGSPDAARRFAEVRAAYLEVVEARRTAAAERAAERAASGGPADPEIEARLAALERELRDARQRRAAPGPPDAQPRRPPRPSDEELGYVTTEDSFSKILDDLLGG
jgi:curved DNA-binding protein CbpA